jgi:hypothetical protein
MPPRRARLLVGVLLALLALAGVAALGPDRGPPERQEPVPLPAAPVAVAARPPTQQAGQATEAAATSAAGSAAGSASSPEARGSSREVEVEVVREGGAPIAGAEVRMFLWFGARRRSNPKEVVVARVDERGRAKLEVPLDLESVAFRARAGEVSSRAVRFDQWSSAAVRLVVGAGGPIEGVVVDVDGRPVVATVTVGDGLATTDVLSDEAGRFRVSGCPEVVHHVRARADGFAQQTFGAACEVVPEPAGAPPVRLVLRRRVPLEGRAVCEDGSTPTDLVVSLRDRSRTHEAEGKRLDGGGFRSSRAVVEGDLVIVACGRDGAGRAVGSRAIVDVRAPGPARVELTLAPLATIRGKTALRAGLQVRASRRDEHAAYRDFAPRVDVDVASDGTFAVEGLTPGPWLLELRHEGLEPALATARVNVVGGQSLEVELLPELELAGPISGVAVTTGTEHDVVTVRVFGPEGLVADRSVADDRSFAFPLLPAGRWTVVVHQLLVDDVRGEYHHLSGRLEVTLAEGQARTGLQVVLEPSAAITGRVVDEGERPVPAAWVVLTPSDRGDDDDRTDHDGRFTLRSVVPGVSRVTLADPDALARVARRRGVPATTCEPVDVQVGPGGTADVTLRLRDAR